MSGQPWRLELASGARRALEKNLDERTALAAWEFISGRLLADPYRVTKTLNEPLDELRAAVLGHYRVVCRIKDTEGVVEVIAIARRADVYGIRWQY